ncbi:MAG: beta-N-acetylhexosaminidase, partial [Bacteroidota bacterium]|nr:beta-N-acetylhexosaminidase [Bacteroidota bacterium]
MPQIHLQGSTSVIPIPAVMNFASGQFEFNSHLTIYADKTLFDSFDPTEVFIDIFEKRINNKIPIRDLSDQHDTDFNKIEIHLNSTISKEGYELNIYDTGIFINASTSAGVFYALQTLRQILNLDIISNPDKAVIVWNILSMQIRDEPNFSYRGMHLDVVRHFMPLDFVKKYIDLLSMHKMNTFHWHLTDDQGWRLEIKQYPKLQEVAAWRETTLSGHARNKPKVFDGIRHGGYYTQDEVRDVIAFAKKRNVNIIPEIEMPGHALAALAAYPELACTPGPFKVEPTWGVFNDVMCPTETTFTFLENVMDEVIALFPSPYIHIGGDECPKKRWEESAFCQDLMKKEGLTTEHQLQSYFIQRMEKYINSKGRRIIGWDEILEGGLAPDATVMSWRGVKGGIAAARQQHEVVMTPGPPCYFDHYQADPAGEPLAIGGLSTVEQVYALQVIPKDLTAAEFKYILGAQGNLWSEYITTPSHAEYMAYPRAIALAEVVWSPAEMRDWTGFVVRLKDHFSRLDSLHVNYAKHVDTPTYELTSDTSGLGLTWHTAVPGQVIYTSLDTSLHAWMELKSGQKTLLTEPSTLYYRGKTTPVQQITYRPS